MKENVVLFGASKMGEIAKSILNESYNIIAFCDNDQKKWGTKFCGLDVVSPELLINKKERKFKIIITSSYYKEIYKQLEENNITDNILKFDLNMSDCLKEMKEIKLREKKEWNEICYLKDFLFKDNDKKENLYLHIMFDNFYTKSFIEFINKNFKQKEHKFLIMVEYLNELKYINEILHFNNVELYLFDGKYNNLIFQSYVNQAKEIFIHYLSDYICKLISEADIPQNCELNWIVWGADLYGYIDRELYCSKTKEFLEHNCKKILSTRISKESQLYRKKIIKRMNYILTNCEGDYQIAKKYFETNAQRKEFMYPNPVDFESINDNNDFNTELNSYSSQINNLKRKYKYIILLGNSGDPSNNHIDILYKLIDEREQNFCIICPLSYGNKKYIEELIKLGEEMFGDRFIPFIEFLNPNDYYCILKKIDIAIMNHRRQQAGGNIIILSYLNKTLYLNKDNPLTGLLNKFNASFSLIDDFSFSKANESNKNYNNIKEYFNEQNCFDIWENIF